MTEIEKVATWWWIIRQADGDYMRLECLATMFFRHPGHDVAKWN